MKNENGFSLLEVIISISALAFVCVFILEIFMMSKEAGKKAKNMDYASNYAMNLIEEFKALNNAGDFLVSGETISSQLAIGSSEFIVIENNEALLGMEITKEINIYKFFDENWGLIELTEIEEKPLSPQNEEVNFVARIHVEPVSAAEGEAADEDAGKLYSIGVELWDVTYQEEKRALSGYRTFKYFPAAPAYTKGVIYLD